MLTLFRKAAGGKDVSTAHYVGRESFSVPS